MPALSPLAFCLNEKTRMAFSEEGKSRLLSGLKAEMDQGLLSPNLKELSDFWTNFAARIRSQENCGVPEGTVGEVEGGAEEGGVADRHTEGCKSQT